MKKILWISVCGILYVHPVQAQTVPQEYILRVKPVDIENIGKALGKLPFEDVSLLIQSLRSQIIEQQQATIKPVEENNKDASPSKP